MIRPKDTPRSDLRALLARGGEMVDSIRGFDWAGPNPPGTRRIVASSAAADDAAHHAGESLSPCPVVGAALHPVL